MLCQENWDHMNAYKLATKNGHFEIAQVLEISTMNSHI